MNGGTCVQDMNNDYICDCPSGFTGSGCEISRMIFCFIYELCAARYQIILIIHVHCSHCMTALIIEFFCLSHCQSTSANYWQYL